MALHSCQRLYIVTTGMAVQLPFVASQSGRFDIKFSKLWQQAEPVSDVAYH